MKYTSKYSSFVHNSTPDNFSNIPDAILLYILVYILLQKKTNTYIISCYFPEPEVI